MKKFTIMFAVLITIITTVAACVLPVAADGEDLLTYVIIDGGAVINYCSRDVAGDFVIPDTLDGCPVKEIRSGAFKDCVSLVSLSIPDSVQNIGEQAFSGCTSLRSVKLPSGISEIPNSAFRNCSALENIVIPDGVEVIKGNAFLNCASIKEIFIPDSVTEIFSNAFCGCSAVEKLTVPFVGGSKEYPECFGYIFGGTNYNLNSSYVPKTLKTVIITGGDRIDEKAFWGCEYIETLVFPKELSDIGERAFMGCTGISSVAVDEENPTYHTTDNCIIKTGSKELVFGFKNCRIPTDGSVTSIASYAFEGNTAIERVTVPNAVKKIGKGAFEGCNAIKEISLPFVGESTTSQKSNFGYIFGCNDSSSHRTGVPESLKTVIITGNCSLSFESFQNCENIVSFIAGGAIKEVKEFAFLGCASLKSAKFDEGLKTLGQSVFCECSALKRVYLPESLVSINRTNFDDSADVVIYCYKDSAAYEFAKNEKIQYKLLDDPDSKETENIPPSDESETIETDAESERDGQTTADTKDGSSTADPGEDGTVAFHDPLGCSSSLNCGIFALVALAMASVCILGKRGKN